MSNYSITPEGGHQILVKDGEQAMCPFVAPFAIPNQGIQARGGGINIHRFTCNTQCPHANVTKNNADEEFYNISCGSGNQFKLSPPPEAPKEKITPGGIIHS